MGRIAKTVVLVGLCLLCVGVVVSRMSATPSDGGQWIATIGAFLMVAGFIAMLPGVWRRKRVD